MNSWSLNGHVDELACFVRPGVVLALSRSNPADVDYPALQDNLERLAAATDARGRRLEIIEIEAADVAMIDKGQSYRMRAHVPATEEGSAMLR